MPAGLVSSYKEHTGTITLHKWTHTPVFDNGNKSPQLNASISLNECKLKVIKQCDNETILLCV